MRRSILLFLSMLIFGLFTGCRGKSSTPENSSNNKEISCPEDSVFSREIKKCIKKCPLGKIFDSNLKECVLADRSTDTINTEILKFKCEGNSYQKDTSKNECVSGLPLFMFNKKYNILNAWIGDEPIAVCIDSDDDNRGDISNTDLILIASNVRHSLDVWIKPLKDSNYPILNFSKDINVYKSTKCNPINWNATVHISSDETLIKKCQQPGACAYPWSREVWVASKDGTDTYVHEFGHLLGFDDHYIYNGGRFCKDGYDINTTVMCSERDQLKPADIEGIKRQYCRFWPETDVCQKKEIIELTDIENGPMITCSIDNSNQSISVVNNYKNATVTLLRTSDKKVIKEYTTAVLSNKLNTFPWVLHTQNSDEMKLEVDWGNSRVTFDYMVDQVKKTIEFSLNDDNTSSVMNKGRCKVHDESLALRLKKESFI